MESFASNRLDFCYGICALDGKVPGKWSMKVLCLQRIT